MSIEKEKVLQVHESIVLALVEFSARNGYSEMSAVLGRGEENRIYLLGLDEALRLNKLIVAYRDDIALRYPYYSDEVDFLNVDHEEKFDFANMDVVGRVGSAVGAAFPLYFNEEAYLKRRLAKEACREDGA